MHFKTFSSGLIFACLYLTSVMAYWNDGMVVSRDSHPDHLMMVRRRARDILASPLSRRFEILDEFSTRDLVEALEARLFLHERGGSGEGPPASPGPASSKPLPDATKEPSRPNSPGPSQKGGADYGIYDILLRHAFLKRTPVSKLPRKKIRILHRKTSTHRV